MDLKSEVKSPDTGVQVGFKELIKHELADADPLSTSTCESATIPARSVKIEDGLSSCNSIDSPHPLPSDFCRSLINFTTPVKTEEEGKWDAELHTSFEVKDEQLLRWSEFDDAFARQDKEGEECKGITSSQEFQTDSSKAFIGPMTRIRPEVVEMTHSSVNILKMNSEIKGELTFQPHESKDTWEKIRLENDLGNNSLGPSSIVQMTSTGAKEDNFSTKTLNCSLCPASFAQKINLTTHTGERRFHCSHCSASFPRKCKLTRHIRTHTGEKPYNCSHCLASFAQKITLTRHMRTHTGEKPFICSHCPASFARTSELTYHMRTHTGEKPFICSHCSNSFTCKQSLINHIRTHTGEKPFNCSHCPASFARKSCLTYHMPTHTGEKPFICSRCSNSFTRKQILINHIRTHTGEKPFNCSHCSASFPRKCKLTRHIRTHTGEKPYNCSHCLASFAQKITLTRHMRTHAGEKPFSW